MNQSDGCVYEFDGFRLNVLKRVLHKDGVPVPLSPKAFEILLALVETPGQVVEKADLIQRVWPDSFVEDNNLSVQVSALRKALGETPDEHRYIVTVPKRGFSFAAQVTTCPNDDSTDAPETSSNDEPSPVEPKAPGFGPRNWNGLRRGWVHGAVAALVVTVVSFVAYLGLSDRAGRSGARSAVLPFRVLDPNTAPSLGIGVADGLILKLNTFTNVSAVPLSRVVGYAGRSYDPATVGRELGADTVVEGVVQRDGNRRRVTVYVIRVSDGEQVWAQTFDDVPKDGAWSQDRIVDLVGPPLARHLPDGGLVRKPESVCTDREARQAYLRGLFFLDRNAEGDANKALAAFEEATAKAPKFAPAYAGLAEARASEAVAASDPALKRELFEQAEKFAATALGLNDGCAEAHAVQAYLDQVLRGDFAKAEVNFKQAIELNESLAPVRHRYALLLFKSERWADAHDQLRRAAELDPVSPRINLAWARSLFNSRLYDQADARCRKMLEIDSKAKAPRLLLARADERLGRYDEAVAQLRMIEGFAEDTDALGVLGHVRAVAGQKREAEAIVKKLEKRASQSPDVLYRLAVIETALDRRDRALSRLEEANRTGRLPLFWIDGDRRLDRLRDDPRFLSLLNPTLASSGPRF